MLNQEQITALVKAEVMKTLSEMGVIKDQISARECWGLCGRRRFEALVANGTIIPMEVQGLKKPKFSRVQVLKAIGTIKEKSLKKIIL